MREKIKQSAKSTNFWNNVANIASLVVLLAALHFSDDKDSILQIIIAYLGASGSHNLGNILAHMNKDN